MASRLNQIMSVLTVEKENPKSENNVLNLSDKVFIKTHVNKTKLFQGEQLVVSYKLYSKINLANIDITSFQFSMVFGKRSRDKLTTNTKGH